MLFMDESGHDHGSLPYEVRGGVCIDVGQVWDLTQRLQRLEYACFGDYLRNYGSEIKAVKLLERKRFKWATAATAVPSREAQGACAGVSSAIREG